MSLASKTYFRFAQEAEQSMEKEADPRRKKEYRKVAAQNYFYSAMEAIESVLQKAGIDSYLINSHNERLQLVKKNNTLFKDPVNLILKMEIMIHYDYRRKVAYKGENGNKFIVVKELARLCQDEIN